MDRCAIEVASVYAESIAAILSPEGFLDARDIRKGHILECQSSPSDVGGY